MRKTDGQFPRATSAGRRGSIDTFSGTGVSPVLRSKHGQDARATRRIRCVGPLGTRGVGGLHVPRCETSPELKSSSLTLRHAQ